MEVNAQIRFYTDDDSWLCFRHATQVAMSGQDVKVEVDNYADDYYMGRTHCKRCSREAVEE